MEGLFEASVKTLDLTTIVEDPEGGPLTFSLDSSSFTGVTVSAAGLLETPVARPASALSATITASDDHGAIANLVVWFSPAAYPESCQVLYDAGSRTDGVFSIDPDGSGSGAPRDMFCRFIDDGSAASGGWDLLMSTVRASSTLLSDWTEINALVCKDAGETNNIDCVTPEEKSRHADRIAAQRARYIEPLGTPANHLVDSFRSESVVDGVFSEIMADAVTSGSSTQWIAYGVGSRVGMAAMVAETQDPEFSAYASFGMGGFAATCESNVLLPGMSFGTEDTDFGRNSVIGGYYGGFIWRASNNHRCPYDDVGLMWTSSDTGFKFTKTMGQADAIRIFVRDPIAAARQVNRPPVIINPPAEFSAPGVPLASFVTTNGTNGIYALPSTSDPDGDAVVWGNFSVNSSFMSLSGNTLLWSGATANTIGAGGIVTVSAIDAGGLSRIIRFRFQNRYGKSCQDIYEVAQTSGATLVSGSLHKIDPEQDGTSFSVICYFETSGALEGGWTIVANQREDAPQINWNAGIAVNRAAASCFNTSFALSQSQIPEHAHTAFARRWHDASSASALAGVSPGDFEIQDAIPLVYTTGNINIVTGPGLNGITTSRSYHVHRKTNNYYDAHNPELITLLTSSLWNNTLTFDCVIGSPLASTTWAFSPANTNPVKRGFSYGLGANGNIDNMIMVR